MSQTFERGFLLGGGGEENLGDDQEERHLRKVKWNQMAEQDIRREKNFKEVEVEERHKADEIW